MTKPTERAFVLFSSSSRPEKGVTALFRNAECGERGTCSRCGKRRIIRKVVFSPYRGRRQLCREDGTP